MKYELFAAAEYGDLEELKKLIISGVNVNSEVGKSSALHEAAKGGFNECVKELISANADLEARNLYQETPLHLACKQGNVACATILIQAGADIHSKDDKLNMPIHSSCSNGHASCAQVLIDVGADVNFKSDYGTPLTKAAQQGNPECVQILVSRGVDVNVKSSNGMTPLHEAVGFGYTEAARILCEAGADINANDNYWGSTPLHSAAGTNSNKECAKLLLMNGADASMLNNEGKTPEQCYGGNKISSARQEIMALEKAALQLEGPQNLPDRPTPRISRGRL